MLQVEILPVLDDNYIFVLHDAASGATAVVDPAEAEPVLAFLQRKGWRLDYVLNTHHHWDHVGGNLELHGATGCRIAGARADKDRIPGLDTFLAEGDRLALGDNVIEVLEVPGHTRAHLAYWLPQAKRLFCGDTLFGLGCGRLFEGSAEQMWASLQKLAALPGETLVYCAHEYTQANGRFARTVEPGNGALAERLRRVAELRDRNESTVPSTLAEEVATNPFLRPSSAEIRATLGLERAADLQVFVALRCRKDSFKA
ncbi:hydroxyacylglutathione hydrolase [Methylogaea oryzae]|uniref:Hydroxyacylglutathione hydrolase n=1 Tax=Methylogaea oryzae TaxID=1295382 RepID=A0A8D5AH32_9GAMM|nr:hydroxyacylglutathione hydrolase [Methylogaea oryzae]BBL71038.1 hydroxyacylglutathione hydrolase [Methylogaea oryzae]